MELSWMGRYRNLVRALVYYSNTSNQFAKQGSSNEYQLNQYQYQILEYICEHENENRIMTDISRDLGILKSNVTTSTRALLEKGLVEKYHIVGNKKSIVLKPTDTGRQVYLDYCAAVAVVFESFFDSLKELSDHDLSAFETAVDSLSAKWNSQMEESLIKAE